MAAPSQRGGLRRPPGRDGRPGGQLGLPVGHHADQRPPPDAHAVRALRAGPRHPSRPPAEAMAPPPVGSRIAPPGPSSWSWTTTRASARRSGSSWRSSTSSLEAEDGPQALERVQSCPGGPGPAGRAAARHGRHRGPGADQGHRRQRGGGPGDRRPDGPRGGGGDEARRARLRDQAVRRGRDPAADPARARAARPRPRGGLPPLRAGARARLRPAGGAAPADAAALPADQRGRAEPAHRADRRGERDGEGARGAGDPPARAAARRAVRSGERRRDLRDASSSRSCSATRRAPSPAPSRGSSGSSSWRTGAPCSWTRSPPSGSISRRRSCGCCRSGRSSGSGGPGASRSTCG